MSPLDNMKLARLKIHAYKTAARAVSEKTGFFEVMFNPASFSQKYELKYSKEKAVNDSNPPAKYTYTAPKELKLNLVLDGTGVHQMGAIPLLDQQQTVSERIDDFLKLTHHMNGELHEPHFLQLEWGGQKNPINNFECRLASVDIKYTLFDRHGDPLRAELDVVFVSDIDPQKKEAKVRTASPDMTHYRVVKAGDTLPLLTKEIYGTAKYYLQIAQINELDNFRNLTPGTTLRFPPVEK